MFDLLCIIFMKLTFLWNFQDEMEIPGFVNIQQRQWVQMVRRAKREDFLDMWGDPSESHQVEDIFDLRQLFGEEPYIEIIEEQ
ncbi:hypothetical protein CAJAP_09764 [Camponotus japonicus]